MQIIPEINYLMALDPTHVCKVQDKENADWGKENGWVHSYSDEEDNEGMAYPCYEEALGG